MSPGTISSRGTSVGFPSRNAVVLICTIESSFSTAFVAPRSCQNPSRPLTNTITRIIIALVGSPRKYERIAANIRMITSGLLNWLRNRLRVSVPFLGLNRLYP